MDNLELLVVSLEFIEENIHEKLKTDEIARACFCSKSSLEKLFRHVNHISVQDYVKRRRMMLAAREISSDSEKSILEIALEYGYTSHEAFARAFKEVWNLNPSEFRNKKYWELYPRLHKPENEGGADFMRKKVDISELYDLFKQRQNCYFVCGDIKGLIPINEVSFKAGDLAILEAMNRMDAAAGDDDMVFRIGGDAFCILTNSDSREYAVQISEKILEKNGEPVVYEGKEIPLYLYSAVTKYEDTKLGYDKLFGKLKDAINESKGQ